MHGHERLEARIHELEGHVRVAMDAKDAEHLRREQEAAAREKAQDKLKAEIVRLNVCPAMQLARSCERLFSGAGRKGSWLGRGDFKLVLGYCLAVAVGHGCSAY